MFLELTSPRSTPVNWSLQTGGNLGRSRVQSRVGLLAHSLDFPVLRERKQQKI